MKDATESAQIHWPESGCQNTGIGPQSHWQELKHLAGTGPSLGTKTELTPPALAHNHTDEKLNTKPVLGRVWVLKLSQHHLYWVTITPMSPESAIVT